MHYPTFQKYLQAEYKGPYMATGIIIEYRQANEDGIVLIDRKFEPYGLAIPGGIAEKMTFAENAIKEGKEETGLDVIIEDWDRPLCVLSDVDQDPRAFISDITYVGKGYGKISPAKDEDAKKAYFVAARELPDLLNQDIWAFGHHKKIMEIYLREKGLI